MLELHNVLWVIPGVIFIYLYNRFRPTLPTATAIRLSGWPYLFFLVIVATLTWFPSNWIVVELFDVRGKLNTQAITLFGSIIFMLFLLYITQWNLIAKIIFFPVEDNFYKKCIEWENKEILLTLKNGKAYHAILWKYPENPKLRHESQTISIIPYKSGYRDETKEVIWNIYYPEYRDKSDLVDMELIIPRAEIITFGKFSKRAFEHFNTFCGYADPRKLESEMKERFAKRDP